MPPKHRSARWGTSARTLMPARLAFVRVLCLAGLLGAIALGGPAARATDYYVAPSGNDNALGTAGQPFLTIQQGVNVAAASDTVHVADGTYTGTGNRNIEFAAADGSTKDITLVGDTAHPEKCILDLGGSANAPARACQFYHQETNKMVFEGFTVQNGYRPHVGGAIDIDQASNPTIRDCIFQNNTAFSKDPQYGVQGVGGAIHVGGASAPAVQYCTFVINTAGYRGGAISAEGGGTPLVQNCTFAKNTAQFGGAVDAYGSDVTLTGCALAGNSAANGGGLSNFASTVMLTGCTLSGNSATLYGGGLDNDGGNVTLTGCALAGNSAADGGGLSSGDGTATLTGCTLSGNSATYGGGVFSSGDGTARLTDDILYNDTDSEVYNNGGGTTSASHCDIGEAIGNTGDAVADNGGNIDADPLFVTPYNRTTGAFDLSLQPGSPCTGAGTTNAPNYSPTDITGMTRANPPTIGAYEGTSATTRTSLKSSANPSTVGQGVTFTATVANTSQGSSAVPTGSVTFSVDSGSAATIALDGNGQAAYSTSSLKAGSHTVMATFTANVRFQGGTSSPLIQSVVALPPAANPQTVSVAHDVATAVTLTGSDPNSPPLPLTYIVVSSPSHGTLSGTAPNLTYTPQAGYQGSDRFTFKVNNGVLDSSTATVTLNVAPGTPTASPQSGAVAHDSAKGITLTGTDPDTPPLPLVFALATVPAHGTLSGFNAATGAVTYTPSAGYQGADSFTFTVSNGTYTSRPATVTLTVAAGVPTANPQTIATATNTAKQITLTGTDPDVPALPLTYSIATGPAHGTLTGLNASTGAVTYTPTAGYFGTDTFTFTVRNGTNTSAPATVTITVTDATPPVVTATADKTSLWPPNGKATTVTISGKVTDAGSGPASTGSYTVTDSEGTSIPGGTFTIKADGTYAFTLNLIASRSGGDKDGRTYTITVTARDNAGNVGTATLTVTVPHDQGK